jgi:N-acetylneuraminate lyase
MIRLLGKYGGIATGKAFMRYIGFEFGGFRLPVKDFDSAMYEAFVSDVKALGMEEWFSKYA